MTQATAQPAGTAFECPVCRASLTAFEPAGQRKGAVCPCCSSRERHRALWILFAERPHLLSTARSLLHFAPEDFLRKRLAAIPALRYITGDLDPRRADLPLDLMDLKLPDEAFDAVLCSHVLEHVPDDRLAMRELHRIVKSGGWLIVMVPLDVWRTQTYEDPAITDPEQRLRAFRQEDHVRLYSPDIAERLRGAGFDVEEVPVAESVGTERARRHGLLRSDHVFICCKRGG
ncbi:MAG: methyltransferase domain-containing protein [Actinomycetota bacterium]|nr:methyltransferase domain-containing protein [Actinomycetota bacterium]